MPFERGLEKTSAGVRKSLSSGFGKHFGVGDSRLCSLSSELGAIVRSRRMRAAATAPAQHVLVVMVRDLDERGGVAQLPPLDDLIRGMILFHTRVAITLGGRP